MSKISANKCTKLSLLCTRIYHFILFLYKCMHYFIYLLFLHAVFVQNKSMMMVMMRFNFEINIFYTSSTRTVTLSWSRETRIHWVLGTALNWRPIILCGRKLTSCFRRRPPSLLSSCGGRLLVYNEV